MDWSRFREALRQGCVDPFEACIKQGKGGSPPPAPDYRGAAEATAASQRVNQVTPYGSLSWHGLGDNPGPTQRTEISLAPIAQRTLDTQMNLSNQMGDIASGALPRVEQGMSQGFDVSNVPQLRAGVDTSGFPQLKTGVEGLSPEVMQRSSDAAYQSASRRLDPQWQQREQMQRTALQNQGLVAGGEAYGNAMRDFDFARNDAYAQARDDAVRQGLQAQAQQFGQGAQNVGMNNQAQAQQFGQGAQNVGMTNQAAAQQLQQNQFLRGLPLNELNALRTGAQVQNPQFQSPGAMPQTNYSGAAQGQGQYDQGLYNAQVGGQNAMTSGLFGLGGAVAGNSAFPWGNIFGF